MRTASRKRRKHTECDVFSPPSSKDQLIEVVGVRNSLHMGVIQIGLGRSVRLGQGKKVEITCKKPMNLQVDGEPWRLQRPAVITAEQRTALIMEFAKRLDV